MDHSPNAWIIFSMHELSFWIIFSIHRPTSLYMKHSLCTHVQTILSTHWLSFLYLDYLSLCADHPLYIYGPSSLYMDCPLHTWTILFKHGPFPKNINKSLPYTSHLVCTWTIISVHGPPSLHMDHIRSVYGPSILYIDRLLDSGICINIHKQYYVSLSLLVLNIP